ncbi:hypothetical protein Tco_0003447 [Tanacetum coccineum]
MLLNKISMLAVVKTCPTMLTKTIMFYSASSSSYVPHVAESTHEHTDDELTDQEAKQIEADDQAIQTILMRSTIGAQEFQAKLFNEWEKFKSTEGESIESYYHRFSKTQLLIAQKEVVGIQLQAEEFDLMVAAGDIDYIEDVNANCVLMANLHQASTSGIQIGKAPIYDSDGTSENDSNVIPDASSVEQSGGTVDQNPATAEEIRAHFESLYNNLATKVERVNMVNRKMRETNADLTTELARYKSQEKCFEINQEKYDTLERGYQKSVYQEQCLTKKIDALHLSSAKQITTLNEEIANLNNQLSKEKSIVSNLQHENKQLKSDFKIRGDTATCSRDLFKNESIEQRNKTGKLCKNKKLYEVFVSQKAKSREQVYFSNTSKTANVSKSFSIPDTESSDDIPSVARKFLNEVKDTLVTLQRVVKHSMNGNITNLSSSTHQEIHKIFKDKIVPIVNQVDTKVLENENDLLLRAVVSQDIMSIVQKNSVVDTFDLQTELNRTKEKLESCIIKKEKEYATLWNDWYKKYEECKYDKILYDKAYNDMQNQIEWLQAQLGDLKGKSINTKRASNTLDHLSQKLEDENVSLEFRVKNYAKENAHLKTTYKNLFDSINVTQAQTKGITDSLQNKLNDMIYENTKLIAQLFDKASEQKNTTKGVDNTAKIRRPQPRNNKKNDRVPSASKSSGMKNKEVDVEEHHRNFPMSKNKRHISSECNNIKLAIQNDQSKVVYGICKRCLITANHDVCVLNYVNAMNYRDTKQSTNVSNIENKKKQNLNVKKPKKVHSKERLVSPTPSELSIFRNLKLLINFVWKFLGTVRFGNDHIAAILDLEEKEKKALHPPKPVPNSKKRLHLLHMDLCGPMRVASINGNRVYNRRTKKIMETMNITFNELLAMAFEQRNSKLGLQGITSGQTSSGLDLTYTPLTITSQKPSKHELDLLLEAMYDDYIGGQPIAAPRTAPVASAPQVP